MESLKKMFEPITLYKKSSTGKMKVWSIEVAVDIKSGKLMEQTKSGYVGFKMKVSTKVTTKLGEQKARTKADKKIREGYTTSLELAEAATPTLSGMQAMMMTVKELMELSKRIPLFIEEKLNGVRGTYHYDLNIILSKGNKVYDVEHIREQLHALCSLSKGSLGVIDFEFFKRGLRVNEISSLVKNPDKPQRVELEAWIFDALANTEDDTPLVGRKKVLSTHKALIESSNNLVLVPYYRVIKPDDISSLYQSIINSKGEGIIARSANASYDWDNKSRRSNVMIKVKPTITSEFLAVGHSYERRFIKGVAHDLILYTCVTPDGATFTVTPEGDVESRCIQPPEFDDDSWYSIEYRELTVNGMPFHGVGKGFRIPEDLDIEV